MSASVRREVLRLAWPVVLQNLCKTLIFYVDTFMIGRVGREAMASMAIVGPLTYTTVALLSGISVGTIAIVARAWGEQDREKQAQGASTAVTLALLVGVLMTAIGILLLPWAAGLYAVEGAPRVAVVAGDYLYFIAAVLLFVCMDNACSGILTASGDTRTPMAASLAGNALNIFLNWVLIFGNLGAPRMGVAGAGLATAAAMAFQACIVSVFLWTRFSRIRLRFAGFRLVTRASMGALVKVIWPAALERLVLQSGFLVYAKVITLLGEASMAAHRVALAVESLTFMPAFGFSVAGSAIVGQCLGAGRPDQAEVGLRESARISASLMSGIGVLFLLFATPLVRIFLPGAENEETTRLAATCLMISAAVQPFLALSMALGGALRGAGDTRSPVVVGLVGVWLIRVPFSWLLAFPLGLGLQGIWMTMIADWLARSAIFWMIWRRGRWKSIKL